ADDDVMQGADGLAEPQRTFQGAGEADAVAAKVGRQRNGESPRSLNDGTAAAIGNREVHGRLNKRRCQAVPTSRRRPGTFTKPAYDVYTGELRCLGPVYTSYARLQ